MPLSELRELTSRVPREPFRRAGGYYDVARKYLPPGVKAGRLLEPPDAELEADKKKQKEQAAAQVHSVNFPRAEAH